MQQKQLKREGIISIDNPFSHSLVRDIRCIKRLATKQVADLKNADLKLQTPNIRTMLSQRMIRWSKFITIAVRLKTLNILVAECRDKKRPKSDPDISLR